MKRALFLLSSVSIASLASSASADVVLAFDGSRCYSGAYQYFLTGNGMVGPNNQLAAHGYTVQTTSTITPAALTGVRIFVTGELNPGTTLSATEVGALQTWIAGGGSLLYLGEGDSSSAANSQFASLVAGPSYGGQYNAFGVTLNIVAPTHPLIQGPGGVVHGITGLNVPGRWVSLSPSCTDVMENPDGSSALVALTYGSGRAVLASDSNFFCYPPTYAADNATLWDNTIAWLDAGGFVSSFCFGDGTGTACPCGNSGSTGNGCANSVNTSGGNLSASGTPSVSADTVVLGGTGMPNSSALYFQGTTQISVVFGDGLRCAGGAILRLGTKTNVGGASQYPVGSDLPVSQRGLVPASGGARTYQCWYRNADPTFCTPSTFNLTNGIQILWQP